MKRLFGLALAVTAAFFAGPSDASDANPTSRAANPNLFRPFGVDMLGANDTHALLKMTRRVGNDFYYAVFDLKSGCVVETQPSFDRVQKLLALQHRDQAVAKQMLADPNFQTELRQYIGLRSRFGLRKDEEAIYNGNIGWNADASKIVIVAAEAMLRSRDGGRTWDEVDTNMSRKPIVTRDGRFALYQRCGDPSIHNYSCLKNQQIGIVDLEGNQKLRVVEAGRGTIERLDPTGQKLVFVRDDEPGKVVVTHLDPATGNYTRAFSIAAPPLKPNTFFTIDPSRNGTFGIFHHWVSDTDASVTVVSMTDGRALYTHTKRFVGTDVDDEGRLAWGTVNLVRAFGTTRTGAIRDAGAGDRIGWAPGGRLLVFDYPRTEALENGKLGDVMCKVVQVRRME